jgi:preprotein translocase subunit SecY
MIQVYVSPDHGVNVGNGTMFLMWLVSRLLSVGWAMVSIIIFAGIAAGLPSLLGGSFSI